MALAQLLRSLTGWPAPPTPRIAHGPAGIRQVGHREYVGGLWEEIGRLQFRYLVEHGLRPEHYLLDVGCGCLRGGVHFIAYLEPGHYLGIDKEPELLAAGLRELGPELTAARRPHLVASADFAFDRFGVPADFALAQSLFTHLPPAAIVRCLTRLRPWVRPGGQFFATFFACARRRRNPSRPHDHGYFAYTREQMEAFGRAAGWAAEYRGGWGHPRGQHLVVYRPRNVG